MARFIGQDVTLEEYETMEGKWRKMRANRKKRQEQESDLLDEIEYYKKMTDIDVWEDDTEERKAAIERYREHERLMEKQQEGENDEGAESEDYQSEEDGAADSEEELEPNHTTCGNAWGDQNVKNHADAGPALDGARAALRQRWVASEQAGDETYAELWEEYKTELAALDKVYRAKTMLDLRIKNLAELCPEALEMDEEENGRQLTAEEAVGMTGGVENKQSARS
ncbi:hypothetical protein BD626DRAFT_576173 [Schizophyllum amplum]|uniref:Uncharacterized protein n=1 Tax=Schizophyllum amplum TaxID=97359 RepID=A0A550BU22_9AGAR|nr:hypothetical protein BD626DRAFT_576173 [Auriculariopsis ampla]